MSSWFSYILHSFSAKYSSRQEKLKLRSKSAMSEDFKRAKSRKNRKK
jgi:hypothetical protein